MVLASSSSSVMNRVCSTVSGEPGGGRGGGLADGCGRLRRVAVGTVRRPQAPLASAPCPRSAAGSSRVSSGAGGSAAPSVGRSAAGASDFWPADSAGFASETASETASDFGSSGAGGLSSAARRFRLNCRRGRLRLFRSGRLGLDRRFVHGGRLVAAEVQRDVTGRGGFLDRKVRRTLPTARRSPRRGLRPTGSEAGATTRLRGAFVFGLGIGGRADGPG